MKYRSDGGPYEEKDTKFARRDNKFTVCTGVGIIEVDRNGFEVMEYMERGGPCP